MRDAYVTVAGNVTADPTIGETKAGDPFSNFRIAVNHSYFDRERGVWLETGTSFYQVSSYRALAVNVFESLRKGMPVVVHGKLRINQWQNGDKQGTEVHITADAVGPNLHFGQADFTPVRRRHFTGQDPSQDENVQAAFAQDGHEQGSAVLAPDADQENGVSAAPPHQHEGEFDGDEFDGEEFNEDAVTALSA